MSVWRKLITVQKMLDVKRLKEVTLVFAQQDSSGMETRAQV